MYWHSEHHEKKVVSICRLKQPKPPKNGFFRAFFVTPLRFSKIKCLIGFQQFNFLLLIIKKKFLNFDFDLHTLGTLYKILKWGKFLLNYVIFGLLPHKSRYIDVNDRKLVIKLFLDLQVVKDYFQSKFGVVLTKKKMFDFHTSNNPTTHLFVETNC